MRTALAITTFLGLALNATGFAPVPRGTSQASTREITRLRIGI